MADERTRTGPRTWTIRVAQEFEIEAATADEALQFAYKLQARKVKGAKLTDAKAAIGERAKDA